MLVVIILWIGVLYVWGTAALTRSAFRSSQRRRHARAPAPKLLTPLDDPMGSVSDLIEYAEKRAVEAHRRAFPDHDTPDGMKSLEDRHPELLLGFGKLTLNEYRTLRENYREASRTQQPIVLPDYGFITLNETRERAGYTRDDTGQYGRYLDGIGYVMADRLDLLDRACEVVLQKHYDKHIAALNALDSQIEAALSIPSLDVQLLRQQRLTEWEQAADTVEKIQKLQELYDGL